jgi:hypothetical protein
MRVARRKEEVRDQFVHSTGLLLAHVCRKTSHYKRYLRGANQQATCTVLQAE